MVCTPLIRFDFDRLVVLVGVVAVVVVAVDAMVESASQQAPKKYWSLAPSRRRCLRRFSLVVVVKLVSFSPTPPAATVELRVRLSLVLVQFINGD